jgi:hypothetical protein
VDEFVKEGRLGGPVVVKVFSGLVAARKFERCSDYGRVSVFDALGAFAKGFLSSLQELGIVSIVESKLLWENLL